MGSVGTGGGCWSGFLLRWRCDFGSGVQVKSFRIVFTALGGMGVRGHPTGGAKCIFLLCLRSRKAPQARQKDSLALCLPC